jgi:parallel beta-helix repeat protein
VDIGADEYNGTIYTFTLSVIRVSTTGSDSNNGLSWALAKQTVQAGIDAAAALGGEVWVATGTYNERINLRAFALVYGGFAGTETQRSQRSYRTSDTVLNGGQGGSVVCAVGCGYQVSLLDGFTIRNGTGTFTSEGDYTGGGIFCDYCSPIISNNIITANSAFNGGGIGCLLYSSPLFVNNTISGNSATNAGGVFCSWTYPTFANNIISFNGTGIYSTGGTPVLRNNCVYNSTWNYSGLSAGTEDIQQDPLFVDNSTGNFHLTDVSPCVKKGNNLDIQPDWLDMDGQPRNYGLEVDIGADEFITPGDANLDGVVSSIDLFALRNNWGKTSVYWSDGDFNYDGLVDSVDLHLMVNNMSSGN